MELILLILLQNYAQTFVGSYKDVNVRVNKLFQGDQGWGLIDGMRIPLQDYQTENLMLSSASGEISLTVPTLAVCRGGFSGTTDAIRLLDTVSTSTITKKGNFAVRTIVPASLMRLH